MVCEDVQTNTISVSPGAQVFAKIPQSGVLRLERNGAAMSGGAEIFCKDGELALHFADGAMVRLKDA